MSSAYGQDTVVPYRTMRGLTHLARGARMGVTWVGADAGLISD